MNQRRPESQRQLALRLYCQGKSISAIARSLDVAYSAAYGWIKKTEPQPEPDYDPAWLLAVSGSWRKAA